MILSNGSAFMQMTAGSRDGGPRSRGRVASLASVLAAWTACSPSAPPSTDVNGQGRCAGCDGSTTIQAVPVCGACEKSSQCAAPLLCNVDGYCALECSASSPCPLGLPCKQGLCVCTTADGGAATDAPPDSEGALSDAGADESAGAPVPAGLVQVATASYGAPVPPSDAGAAFNSTVAFAQFTGAGGPCLPSTVAGCLVYSCFGALPPGPNAGAITLTGGLLLDGGIVLEPDPDAGGYGSYSDLLANDFPAGTSIAISAAGGEVPSFTTSVKAASDVSIVSLPTSIDRQRSSTVTWTYGAMPAPPVGQVIVSIGAQSPDVTVVCEGPVSSGSLTLPAVALRTLPTGHLAVMQLNVQNETTTTAGATPVTARHSTIVHTASGNEQRAVAVPIVN